MRESAMNQSRSPNLLGEGDISRQSGKSGHNHSQSQRSPRLIVLPILLRRVFSESQRAQIRPWVSRTSGENGVATMQNSNPFFPPAPNQGGSERDDGELSVI